MRTVTGSHPEREGFARHVIPSGSQGSALDVEALRAKEFPWIETDDVIYLNAASTGPQPRRTVDKLVEWA